MYTVHTPSKLSSFWQTLFCCKSGKFFVAHASTASFRRKLYLWDGKILYSIFSLGPIYYIQISFYRNIYSTNTFIWHFSPFCILFGWLISFILFGLSCHWSCCSIFLKKMQALVSFCYEWRPHHNEYGYGIKCATIAVSCNVKLK